MSSFGPNFQGCGALGGTAAQCVGTGRLTYMFLVKTMQVDSILSLM